MTTFEDIIDFLALKGVKSLHIEMQERQLTDEERARLTRRLSYDEIKGSKVEFQSCKCVAKHDQIVHRGEPGAGEPCSVEISLRPPMPLTVEPVVETKAVESKATVVVPELKAVEPVVEKKAAPEPAKKVTEDAVAKPSDKNLYDAFCDMISSDDGTVTVEERLAKLDLMGLDDLLRVNNDFQLGLDTDKPIADLRADVIECFK